MLVAVRVDAVTLSGFAGAVVSVGGGGGGGGADCVQAAVVTESVEAGLTLPAVSTARTE